MIPGKVILLVHPTTVHNGVGGGSAHRRATIPAVSDAPPPGWYPDPTAPGMVRWWSGWSWVGEPSPPESILAGRNGLRDIGALVRDAWAPIERHLGDLFRMAGLVFAPVAALLLPVLYFAWHKIEIIKRTVEVEIGTSGETFEQVQYHLDGVGANQVAAGVLAALVIALASGVLWLGAARMLLVDIQGSVEEWNVSLRLGMRRFWRALAAVIGIGAATIAPMLSAVAVLWVRNPALLLVILPPSLFACAYIGLRLQLAPIIAAVAPLSVSPLRASWDRVGTRILGVLGRIFVLSLLTSLAGVVVSVPGAFLELVLAPILGTVITSGAAVVIQLVAAVYTMAGTMLIWVDLGGELDRIEVVDVDGSGRAMGVPVAE